MKTKKVSWKFCKFVIAGLTKWNLVHECEKTSQELQSWRENYIQGKSKQSDCIPEISIKCRHWLRCGSSSAYLCPALLLELPVFNNRDGAPVSVCVAASMHRSPTFISAAISLLSGAEMRSLSLVVAKLVGCRRPSSSFVSFDGRLLFSLEQKGGLIFSSRRAFLKRPSASFLNVIFEIQITVLTKDYSHIQNWLRIRKATHSCILVAILIALRKGQKNEPKDSGFPYLWTLTIIWDEILASLGKIKFSCFSLLFTNMWHM